MEIRYHTTCLLCGSRKLKSLDGYEKHDLLKCSDCSFVFMRRIPTQEELYDHYSVYAYEKEKEISLATKLSYFKLLNKFGKYRKSNKILDVGCGEGWFLELAKERCWEIYGTEFSARAIEICEGKGIKIYKGVLNPENMEETNFDIIISSETLEHINNPRQECSNIYKLLRKGGLFYITTPNFNSYLRLIQKEKYSIIEYPEHLSYYSKKTLDKLLQQSGFYKLKLMTTGISLAKHRIEFENSSLHNVKSKSTDERLRKRIAGSLILQIIKSLVNVFLTFLGIGMTLKAFYIKK